MKPFSLAAVVSLGLVLGTSGCKKKTEEAAASDVTVAGLYKIESASNPGGSGSYKGNVAISKIGSSFAVNWTLTTQAYAGVALLRGNTLSVGWGTGKNFGVLVYTIEGRTMTGEWTSATMQGKIGTEVIEQEGDSQNYTITSGKNPDGKPYSGSVSITPTGGTSEFYWKLNDGTSYKGVGVREGNQMRVGWGIGKGAGLVIYEVSGKKLNGKWATPGGTKLGTEIIVRD